MQENDPDTVKLVRPTPDERPLHEQWSEEAQKDATALTAQAREQVLEGPVTHLEDREAELAPHTPEQQARDWSRTVTDHRLAEKIQAGVPIAKGEREALAVREMESEPDPAVAGVLANGETVTADDLDGMPWYEARVEVYVRNGPPGDEYGVGGDKIAHTRAATQAPSFNAAAPRLDMQLAEKWQQVLNMAPLADQAPSPDAPVPDPYADLKRNPQYRKVWWLAVGWMITALLLTIVVVILLAA